MAHLFSDQGMYAGAESLYVSALAIAKKTLGAEHTLVASVMKGLADLWYDQERYSEAESHYEQALTINENALGGDHPDVARVLEAMSGLYRVQDMKSRAREFADQAYRVRHKNFADNERGLSERDALTYSYYLRRSVSSYLSSYVDLGSAAEPSVEVACDIVFSSKGQISDRMFERQKGLVEETDSTTLVLAESLRYTKFELSLLFVEGPGEDYAGYRSQMDSLSKAANDLEAELSRRSASFTRIQDYRDVSTDRIAGLLPEGSTLVEYVEYDYITLRPRMWIPHYSVIVVTPGSVPVIAHLGEASGIDSLVDEYRAHMLRIAGANRRPTEIDRTEYVAIGRDLYERLWAPVDSLVVGKELVFVAPDGALNMVSFGGLMDSDTTYLVERVPVHHLSSGRDVIRLKDDPEPGIGLFALGDPDYDAVSEDTPVEIAAYVTRNVRSSCGELKDLEAIPLPGTRSEIEEITLRWKESTGEPATAYYGAEAGEENFKTDAPGKRAIHLATHGYFLESRCQPAAVESDFDYDRDFAGENPLLLSGLLLAGANRHGAGADSLGAEDGILTAYEVTAMNLRGVETVVLSACETGLGKVEEGEGVYGLRRAFQMAGARTVISALWSVPDVATADMIGRLYDRENESIPETMRRLQMDKLEELRREGQSDHPFTWAGFIAMGDWR